MRPDEIKTVEVRRGGYVTVAHAAIIFGLSKQGMQHLMERGLPHVPGVSGRYNMTLTHAASEQVAPQPQADQSDQGDDDQAPPPVPRKPKPAPRRRRQGSSFFGSGSGSFF